MPTHTLLGFPQCQWNTKSRHFQPSPWLLDNINFNVRGLISGDHPDDSLVFSTRKRFEHVDRVDVRSIGDKRPPSGERSPKYVDTFPPATLGPAPRLASETPWAKVSTVDVGRGGLYLIVRRPEHNGGKSIPPFLTNVQWNSYCACQIPNFQTH